MNENSSRLRQLILDVFLLDESEFRFDLSRDDVDTWDSLGVVSLAVGVNETFGYHMNPEEANSIRSVEDVIRILEPRGVHFDR